MYFIYMLRCEDGSLYTGITCDLERRFKEHLERGPRCAKYTYTHPVKKVEKVWQTKTRQEASQLEYWIKQLTKKQKESLLQEEGCWISLLSSHVDVSRFLVIEKNTYDKVLSRIKGYI